MSLQTLQALSAEIVLVAVAVAVYLGGAFSRAQRVWAWIGGGGILAAAVALAASQGGVADAGPAVAVDGLANFTRWLALALGGLLVLLAARPLEGVGTPEYVGSLLLAVAGLMLSAAANDLVLLFLGLELISIPTYILLYLGRRDAASQEAAAKYFFLSLLASAVLLYGFSFLYGVGGSTSLGTIRQVLAASGSVSAGLGGFVPLALVLILAGLAFKVAAVPFHFYAPDVYQGTTHANAALLSVIPKAAGLVALVRIVLVAIPPAAAGEGYAWRIAAALAVLSMTFGNVVALWQDHLRRLLAYSSIAQAGYLLVAVAVGLATAGTAGRWDPLGAMLFYLCVYAVATVGTFALLIYLGHEDRPLEAVDDLAGLGRTRPLSAAALAAMMFSLTGIPPLAGFWGKLVVFGSALTVDSDAADGRAAWLVALAVIGVLNAAISAGYYLRIVAVMYFRTPLATPRAQGGRAVWCAALLCTVLAVGLGLYPGPLLRGCSAAAAAVSARFAPPTVGGLPSQSAAE